MKTNEENHAAPEDVIELGVASIETKGLRGTGEVGGPGMPIIPGISEE